MRKAFGKIILTLAILLLTAQVQAATISFLPSPLNGIAGSQTSIGLWVEGVASGEYVSGFNLDIGFNSALVNITGHSFNPGWGILDDGDFDDLSLGNSGGTYNFGNVSWMGDEQDFRFQSGSFLLGTLFLDLLAPGSSLLGLSGSLFDFNGNEMSNLEFGTGQLSVQPVPLPAAAWMLLAGLGGVAAVRKRRMAA